MRILIVKMSAFGDIVHALPILPAIKDEIPSARIYWAVDSTFTELLDMSPHLSGIVPLPLKGLKKGLSFGNVGDAMRKIGYLRNLNLDLSLDVQGNFKSGLVSLLSGAELKYGFDRDGVRELPNLLFTNRKVRQDDSDGHITQKILRVGAAALGTQMAFPPGGGVISPTVEMKESLARKVNLDESGVKVAIHHGTTWDTKKLSVEKWISLIEAIIKRFGDSRVEVFLTWGGAKEKETGAKIVEGVKPHSTGLKLSLAPPMSIGELASFYSKMDLVIGPDTGPLHLAAAVGAKTISLYRVTKGERNAPVGPGHRYLQSEEDCAGSLKKVCDHEKKCEMIISTDDFIRYIEELSIF